MAVKELKEFVYECDDCGITQTDYAQYEKLPSGWAWRYDEAMHMHWDPYTKMDYEEHGWNRLLCCSLCKDKHKKWEDIYKGGSSGR